MLNSEMKPSTKLLIIKWVHTGIWLFFVVIIFYILYSGIINDINIYTWIAIAIVLMEGIVLLIYKMFCPLTILARKYSDSSKDNFDIFLPNWLARHNKAIFTTIFVIGVILILVRVGMMRT